ncbi:Crp family transcriptional regulator [Microlunatus phosphovorus NM-1]|uniref:Crp family transcriptional regulator n=1 Tax=Microlunatus phosphovorus (strain ATCC 700054 / DSM 10555 / JCM 9379 / NBRC 101784 / NCIMB 13414 / VKM Ac-1990 / NM-1) TaxID=1032480 RepID=F5XHB1_MICPN|nr:Crp/Fnr family transcriptional regulator [Microlunatus phosphovorus]BAK38119.1 Crp family transcriptional regulator [Microlunatus phosphovorus NM-1]
MNRDEVLATLRRTSVFGGLDGTALGELAAVCVPRTYRRDQYLMYQGDPGDHLAVVVEGLVKITVTSDRGDEMVLATVGAGEVLGELSLIDQGPRSASAVAVQATTALVVNRAALLQAMQRSPVLLDELLRTLGAMVRRLTEQASDLVFLDLGGRVAKLLVQTAERQPGRAASRLSVDLHLTQTELAQMVGASRPAVNRVLQSLVGRGWIDVDGKTIEIRDAAALRRRAGL